MSFTVGQLAKLTGLTVRALHHYDAIGLLVPSTRSESGYRLYAKKDIVRLYRILALQRLGLSLAEIESVLAKDGAPLPEIVAQQLEELSDRIEHATALRARLMQLRDVLVRGGEPVASYWLETVELITQYDKYCSSEELTRLLAHKKNNQDDWLTLIADVRAAMNRGVLVESAEGQSLGDRWRHVVMSSVGGDTSLAIKMKAAYFDSAELQARIQAQSGLDSELEEYLWRIWRHGHIALWIRHLGAADARRLDVRDDCMREWVRVVAGMRMAVTNGESPDSEPVQRMLQEWEKLIDAFAAGDPGLRSRVLLVIESAPDLQREWAVDEGVLAFVERARESSRGPGVAGA